MEIVSRNSKVESVRYDKMLKDSVKVRGSETRVANNRSKGCILSLMDETEKVVLTSDTELEISVTSST